LTRNDDDLAGWAQSLIARSVEDQVATIQRYSSLLQQAATGNPSLRAVRENYVEFVQNNSRPFARELAALSLNYYGELLRLSREFNERFFERVFLQGEGGSRESQPAAARELLEMELAGELGGEAQGSLVIENKRPEATQISFAVSEFSFPPKPPFRPPLEIIPAAFSLGPLEEQIVTFRLPLLPELFATGGPYRATIQVVGHDDLEVSLSIQVKEMSTVLKPVKADQHSAERATKPRAKRTTPAQKSTKTTAPAPRVGPTTEGQS
jgi:hypothetical protein